VGGASHRLVPGTLAELGGGPALGNDIHSLPQGLSERDESSLLCHRVYGGRTCDHRRSRRGVSGRRQTGPGDRGGGASRTLLALSRWVLLGSGRFVSIIC